MLLNKQAINKYGAAAMEGVDQWAYISDIVESKNAEQCRDKCLLIA